jgi:hypothetical protein
MNIHSMRCFAVDTPENSRPLETVALRFGRPINAGPGQLEADRDHGFDTSVAAPNAKQGRTATVIERG